MRPPFCSNFASYHSIMRNFIFIFALSLCASTTLWAQGADTDWRLYKKGSSEDSALTHQPVKQQKPEKGQIDIVVDSRIVLMDSLKRAHPSPMEGYRVQIFFGSRADAQKKRGEFLKEYPDVPVYISYLAPNFRLRVGDFRTKMECEKLKKEIQKDYPGCYIVKDEIQLPVLRPAKELAEE